MYKYIVRLIGYNIKYCTSNIRTTILGVNKIIMLSKQCQNLKHKLQLISMKLTQSLIKTFIYFNVYSRLCNWGKKKKNLKIVIFL